MILTIRTFMKFITAAGTNESLTNLDKQVSAVLIQAESTNTGIIYVGDNTVSATNYGAELAATDSMTIKAQEFGDINAMVRLDSIYLDTSVSTDGVSVLYMQEEH